MNVLKYIKKCETALQLLIITILIFNPGILLADAFNVGDDYREKLQEAVRPIQEKLKKSSSELKKPSYYQSNAIFNAFASFKHKLCKNIGGDFFNIIFDTGQDCYGRDTLDLSNKDLSNLNLNFAYFRRINFENSNFENSSLKYAYFGYWRSKLKKVNFANADLSFSYGLSECNDCNFKNAVLSFSDRLYGKFQNANFTKANLISASFGPSDFRNAVFRDTILDYANFSAANFHNSKFINVKVKNAIFLDATGISPQTIQLLKKNGAITDKHVFAERILNGEFSNNGFFDHYSKSSFRNSYAIQYTDLSDINLSNSDLRAFSFYYCKIENTDMSNVNLAYVHIIDTSLKNVKLDGANMKNVYIPRTGKTVMDNVSLLGADLTNADIRGEIINVRYNSKPIDITGKTIPPTKFGTKVTVSGKRFHPSEVEGLIDISEQPRIY